MRERKIYWLTGQPGAGKTVLSILLKEHLEKTHGEFVFRIDGDDLRSLFKNMNYGKEGRLENIRRAQDIAKYIHNQGYDVIVSAVTPYRDIRENFKNEMNKDVVEIFVHTTNIRGREHFHTEYEEPLENFINIDTTDIEPITSLKQILEHI